MLVTKLSDYMRNQLIITGMSVRNWWINILKLKSIFYCWIWNSKSISQLRRGRSHSVEGFGRCILVCNDLFSPFNSSWCNYSFLHRNLQEKVYIKFSFCCWPVSFDVTPHTISLRLDLLYMNNLIQTKRIWDIIA